MQGAQLVAEKQPTRHPHLTYSITLSRQALSSGRKILIIVNPAAGQSSYEGRLQQLEKKLQAESLDFQHFYTRRNDKGQLAAFVDASQGFTDLMVMGGDGTLNYVVNELQGRNLPIGIVSNGTGNDSVKSLHGVTDFHQQVDIAIHGMPARFDLGLCNGRYFVNGVGIGFDGQVVKEMTDRGSSKSKLDYLRTVLRIVYGFKEQMLEFSIDGKTLSRKVLLLTVSNGTTFGGGFVINPFAKTNDGQLDICILNEVHPLLRFWHLPKLKNGSHHKIKAAEFYRSQQMSIAPSDRLVAHLDGEYIGHPPFDISIQKAQLLVMVKKQ